MSISALKNNGNPNSILNSKKDFIDLSHFSYEILRKIIEDAKSLKKELSEGVQNKYLAGKQLIMIFEKNSTRTRVSFEVGINQLGGSAIYLSGKDSQIGRGEPIEDTAGVLSRYGDIIMIRTYEHETLKDLAKNSSIPVINGLTDYSHPCQIMADILTIEESFDSHIDGKTIAWFGDVNNVLVSWLHAAEKFGFKLNIATPFEVDQKFLNNDNIKLFDDPLEAAKSADVITTDTWVSMGEGDQAREKRAKLQNFQVNDKIMHQAKKDAIFLHCLPAHRGDEVTADIIDGKQSVIYDEAENRLHVQKAIMIYCLS
jgi:ornithine carbamoyltransferase